MILAEHTCLATFFNFEISGLADRLLREIEENVNPGMAKRQFSKIPFENRKNMPFQIVVCHSRQFYSGVQRQNLRFEKISINGTGERRAVSAYAPPDGSAVSFEIDSICAG